MTLDYINTYFEKRNIIADTYSNGRKKAKLSNLKMYSAVTNYLITNNVATLEAFRFHVSEKQGELYDLKSSMKNKSAQIKVLKELIRYGEWYKEGQRIIREICSTTSTKQKEQIKSDHDAIIRRYHIAKRILFEENSIQNSYDKEYKKYRELSAGTKTLREINKYIDDALRGDQQKRREEPER